MFKISIDELKSKAYRIRHDLIELIYRARSGHLDTSLSLVDVWLSLVHSDFFQYDPKNGEWEDRDRIFLSEGHACPAQYLINADLGYYDKKEVFAGNRRPFTSFQGHTKRKLSYGFENSNGSLGIGLWQAYGMALETGCTGSTCCTGSSGSRVFCICGDGEFQEPSSIGLLTAPHYLKPAPNFTLIINYNHLAQDSTVDLGPIEGMAELYGWQVIRVNGHSFPDLGKAFHQAIDDKIRPSLLVCDTIKGKGGDPAREGKLGYHGVPPKTEDEYRTYMEGLEAQWRI